MLRRKIPDFLGHARSVQDAPRSLTNVSYLPLHDSICLWPAWGGDRVRNSKRSSCGGQLMRRIGLEQTTRIFSKEVFESMHGTFCGLARKRVARAETRGSIVDDKGIAIS